MITELISSVLVPFLLSLYNSTSLELSTRPKWPLDQKVKCGNKAYGKSHTMANGWATDY
jgi:hypothetical protein